MLMQFARLKSSQPIEGFGTSVIDRPTLARHYQCVLVRESQVRPLLASVGSDGMEVDLHILYRLLRAVAVRRDLIVYTPLSEQYEQQTGDWVDPHLGWRFPLANIAYRCAGLCRAGHQPILPALVINDPEGPSDVPGRPGMGFWGLRCSNGQVLTPDQPSDAAWSAMCTAVYQQNWPEEFDGLPAPCNAA